MRRHDIQEATGRNHYNPGYGHMEAWGKTTPTDGQQGFAPGCTYKNLTGAAGSALYVNIGTFASSNWLNIG